ncbi:hypothetical protein BN13_390046 [Nostocoides jenkinsii Ben 74]|uniref:Helix-turn-helix domain-containing protein n=1 Tax=Nostocoides jenkinsii Ben 74 TaxID=1193518 RepID=A0A077MA23_9MICO|nr:hypothetical protein BN13_390046 [Tetrasphaera jenkinsii Ben 74]
MTQKPRRQFESLAQAAERTGLSTRTLRRRIAAGALSAYRNGPRVIRLDPGGRRPADDPHTNSQLTPMTLRPLCRCRRGLHRDCDAT